VCLSVRINIYLVYYYLIRQINSRVSQKLCPLGASNDMIMKNIKAAERGKIKYDNAHTYVARRVYV